LPEIERLTAKVNADGSSVNRIDANGPVKPPWQLTQVVPGEGGFIWGHTVAAKLTTLTEVVDVEVDVDVEVVDLIVVDVDVVEEPPPPVLVVVVLELEPPPLVLVVVVLDELEPPPLTVVVDEDVVVESMCGVAGLPEQPYIVVPHTTAAPRAHSSLTPRLAMLCLR